jgi:dTDP-4-dehydrorhamnose reductase
VRRLLVTGAGGMLGQDVVAQARRTGHEVVALGRAQLDIADAAAVDAAIANAAPDVVINCAAWTDVDGAEADPQGALAVNGAGAGTVAGAAGAVGAHVVHVSTDYVFSGDAGRAYVESDATDPQSAYGRSKLAGERAVIAASPDHAVVRSSWLFGLGGRNFVETMLSLSAAGREEVSVVTDQVGCPTFTGHLARALIGVAARGGGGVFHVAGAGACSWNEFAIEIFAQADVDCRVLPTTTAAIGRPAPRPAYSAMSSERPDAITLPRWQDGLRAYLEARGAARGVGVGAGGGSR